MHSTANPIQKGERAAILDAVRGFALLGICLANAGYFSLYIFQKPQDMSAYTTAAVDVWLKWVHYIFIDGKFYSIFSLLFGIGFAIIFFNKSNAGQSRLNIFYRRLFFLMVFGLVHSFLLWDGDILFFYAVVGAFLPLFRKAGNKTLIVLAIILILSPVLFDVIKVLTDGQWNLSRPLFAKATSMDKQVGITQDNISTWLIRNDRYAHLLDWNRSGFWWSWQLRVDSNRAVKVFAMFLIGLYIGRNRLYTQLNAHLPVLRQVQKWGFLIGIPAGFANAYFHLDDKVLPEPLGLADTIAYALNVAPLSLAYVATFCIWYCRNSNHPVLKWLQPVGSMALTNYMMQTVFGIAIYYGIGAGLGSGIGPSVFLPVAVAIFLVQTIYSHYWFRFFNYGPLEWIWRQLTYGKRLALVKTKAALPSDQ